MLCSNCGSIVSDDAKFCNNCGSVISTTQQSITQNKIPAKSLDKDGRPRMVFNIVFAIWLLTAYWPSALSTLAVFECKNIVDIIMIIIPAFIGTFVIATSILLLKRHHLGFIFQYIVNIVGLLCNLLLFALSILILFVTTPENLSSEFNLFIDIFCWMFLIVSLPGIGMHTAGLIYYTKKKDIYHIRIQ